MAYFPGNIMVIDDKYALVHHEEPREREDQIQYNSLLGVKKYCEANGIPLIAITDPIDAEALKKTIEKYDNVRMLILDLDLNNDGNVNPEDDYETIFLILRTALKKFGYFLLLINSAHAEAWESIKKVMPEDINPNLIKNLTHLFDKTKKDNAYDALTVIGKNYSAELIYDFETMLNSARDKAFGSFLEFEKDGWKKIYETLFRESGEIVHNDITNILLGIVKQHLLNDKYKKPEENIVAESSDALKQLIYKTINYSLNKNNIFGNQKIWTGNLYKTNLDEERRYALVITPECDIANNKHIFYKILFGFAINEVSLPLAYDNKNFTIEQTPPLFAYRSGTRNENGVLSWGSRKFLISKATKHESPNQFLYPLPFVEGDPLFLDFRDVTSISEEKMKENNWELLLRINESMITDIIDKYSNLYNRKGLLPILFS